MTRAGVTEDTPRPSWSRLQILVTPDPLSKSGAHPAHYVLLHGAFSLRNLPSNACDCFLRPCKASGIGHAGSFIIPCRYECIYAPPTRHTWSHSRIVASGPGSWCDGIQRLLPVAEIRGVSRILVCVGESTCLPRRA